MQSGSRLPIRLVIISFTCSHSLTIINILPNWFRRSAFQFFIVHPGLSAGRNQSRYEKSVWRWNSLLDEREEERKKSVRSLIRANALKIINHYFYLPKPSVCSTILSIFHIVSFIINSKWSASLFFLVCARSYPCLFWALGWCSDLIICMF